MRASLVVVTAIVVAAIGVSAAIGQPSTARALSCGGAPEMHISILSAADGQGLASAQAAAAPVVAEMSPARITLVMSRETTGAVAFEAIARDGRVVAHISTIRLGSGGWVISSYSGCSG